VPAPDNIVILAIDDESLTQSQFSDLVDPEQNQALQPIQTWPWQRTAYAIAIEKLATAGTDAIVLDLLLTSPSGYDAADDTRLTASLEQYGNQVVLASELFGTDVSELPDPELDPAVDAGSELQIGLISPLEPWRTLATPGLINMPLAPNGRVHELGHEFLNQLARNDPQSWAALEQMTDLPQPLADATLQTAAVDYAEPRDSIFFYGPQGTFEHISFWKVLDPDTWANELQSGQVFQDKIVLIGGTAESLQDFHETPFSRNWPDKERLSGVEIQANAIATLQENKSLGAALPHPLAEGALVLIGVAGVAYGIRRSRQPLYQFVWTAVAIGAWTAISYGVFVYGLRFLPVAVPGLAIAGVGISQITLSAIHEQIRKQQLRQTLKHYAALPIVQEIISQQDDLRDLLLEREAAIFGKILGGRYRVVKVLGTGGFSETYIAEDTQRPSNPACVVKRLRLLSDKPNMLKLMRRLFLVEAETLERLGQHSQIPHLLAYFEENQEFYLVQELIDGRSLHGELVTRGVFPPENTIRLLDDLLPVLDFVHNQDVIHRDIKPVNIIRRSADAKPVLIDFGIAKRLSHQVAEADPNTKFTIGLGTKGYMPSEQAAGMPQFSSDIYALGMTAIETLTGLTPSQLPRDNFGNVIWADQALTISPEFKDMLCKMVHYDFAQRFRTVREVMAQLKQLPEYASIHPSRPDSPGDADDLMNLQNMAEAADLELEEASADTQVWEEN
jgi:CHASE2 domain-containing sensor protein